MSTSTILAILAVAYLVACVPLIVILVRSYARFRGRRVVVCPESKEPVEVRVDAVRASITEALDQPKLRLESCSRWPEREGCGQECLAQIESAEDGCLVREMLARWYANSRCAVCSRPFSEIHWYDHKPAFLDPEGHALDWNEVAAQDLPRIFATHQRLCWDCQAAQTFRRDFPDRVIDDPRKPVRRNGDVKPRSVA
jgi:hypothetical protein